MDRKQSKIQETRKQTFGGGKWYLVQIFGEMSSAWPTKIILDTVLRIFHHLKLFQLLPSSTKLF